MWPRGAARSEGGVAPLAAPLARIVKIGVAGRRAARGAVAAVKGRGGLGHLAGGLDDGGKLVGGVSLGGGVAERHDRLADGAVGLLEHGMGFSRGTPDADHEEVKEPHGSHRPAARRP